MSISGNPPAWSETDAIARETNQEGGDPSDARRINSDAPAPAVEPGRATDVTEDSGCVFCDLDLTPEERGGKMYHFPGGGRAVVCSRTLSPSPMLGMETSAEEWAQWIADQEGEDSHHAILKDSPLHRAKRDFDRAFAEIGRLKQIAIDIGTERSRDHEIYRARTAEQDTEIGRLNAALEIANARIAGGRTMSDAWKEERDRLVRLAAADRKAWSADATEREAKAREEEREACAKIADDRMLKPGSGRQAAGDIRDRIRSRSTP